MIVGPHLIENEKDDQRSDDRQYQAGRMKQSPSRGLENSRAISPPTIEPTIPSKVVPIIQLRPALSTGSTSGPTAT